MLAQAINKQNLQISTMEMVNTDVVPKTLKLLQNYRSMISYLLEKELQTLEDFVESVSLSLWQRFFCSRKSFMPKFMPL